MPKNILIILGHPESNSFCGAIAENYLQGAQEAGHHVKLFKLGECPFNPILLHGYRQRQDLEPCLQDIQVAITWAQHIVWVYPIWWGSMPALLKGFFDRVLLPGYAFKYREKSALWDKKLTGRSAHVLVTMDTPAWYDWLVYHRPWRHQIKKTLLHFCGIAPVKTTAFASVRYASNQRRQNWLASVKAMAKKVR